MLFSSLFFLFLFLPITLIAYLLLPKISLRNGFLLFASLFFYAWGEVANLWLITLLIMVNYSLAVALGQSSGLLRKLIMSVCISINLGVLFCFKYADFFIFNINGFQHSLFNSNYSLPFTHFALPMGISFFTFHCLSYVIDVYRRSVPPQKDPLKLALYIAFFPQLLAGPIVRYHELCDQLSARSVTADKFAEGIRRFVVGLGKKMLVANTLSNPVKEIFSLPPAAMSLDLAWLAALGYTLQIYFDFSGYSDMAVGLGLMFGFRLPENFNFPYISTSIREFWRRWHISLSNWFRDYLYIPLGGNRFSTSRTCFNLVLVFFLCGLWHGANWTFIVWGLYHGAFLGLERIGLSKLLDRLWKPLTHVYTLIVITLGWVVFRAENISQAANMISAMFGLNSLLSAGAPPIEQYLNGRVAAAVVVGIAASTPLFNNVLWDITNERLRLRSVLRLSATTAVFILSIVEMASGSYNPFLYLRF